MHQVKLQVSNAWYGSEVSCDHAVRQLNGRVSATAANRLKSIV